VKIVRKVIGLMRVLDGRLEEEIRLPYGRIDG